MPLWRNANVNWEVIAIIVTIIGAAYLLGRHTVTPDEVRNIVTNTVNAAIAPLATREEVRNIATNAVNAAIAPLATRDEVRNIATNAVGAAIAPLATRDEVRATRDAVNLMFDTQRAQSFCLSFLYATIQDLQPPQQFGQDASPCDLTALNPFSR